MTAETTLTDRYVWAVVRLLPEDQRDEIGREVRALVGDLVASREDADDPSAGADPERDVLVELGDPNLLAARYVEKPRALIGQELFPEYVRSLKVVAAIAVPALVALTIFGTVIGGDATAGEVLWAAARAAYQAALQTAFWVTLVYAFAHRWKGTTPWTPDDLPEPVDLTLADGTTTYRGPSLAELVFGIVITALAAVVLVWQQVSPWVRDGDDRIPALHPDMWSGPGQALVVLLALSVVVQLVVLARRRWTYRSATVNLLVNGSFLGVVAWLSLDDRLINPRLLEVVADGTSRTDPITVNPWIPILLVAAIEVWDAAEAFLHAHRQERR